MQEALENVSERRTRPTLIKTCDVWVNGWVGSWMDGWAGGSVDPWVGRLIDGWIGRLQLYVLS